MTHTDREFDIVVWGATGFTGQLTAEYLLRTYGSDSFRWALGGRSESKLEAVRAELGGAASELPLVIGDAQDAASMESLAERSRVVCSSVGPYALYGSALVAACAKAGTHYTDLTGEAHWMRRMIDTHEDAARESGARIVHNCGFDCIPSDLGTFFVQRAMAERHGVPCSHVKLRVESFSGAASGGTIATMLNMMEEAERDPEVVRVMNDPYGINPKDQQNGPDTAEGVAPAWDSDFEQWTVPFVMASINTKVVRRSNALLDYRYGKGFRYDEAILMGKGPVGLAKAVGTSAATAGGMTAFRLGAVRRLLGGLLPSPGDGPSREQQEKGHWNLALLGLHPTDPSKNLRARAKGDRDPGYGSTSKMLGESAVCLALDDLAVEGGFWTPAAAMGEPLLERLPAKAGVSFALED